MVSMVVATVQSATDRTKKSVIRVHLPDFPNALYEAEKSAMKVLFDTKKVQKLGRIVLSDTLLRNAGLQEGDAVEIYFDVASKHIIIQRAESSAAETLSAESTNRKRNQK